MNSPDHTKNANSDTSANIDSASPAVMDYEGSDYQERFWGGGERDYEDRAERIALRKLVPPTGRRLVEFGAAFGRLADLYYGYEQVILLDYSRSLLEQARARLGSDPRFVFVAANLYKLPLVDDLVDTGVIVRVMHHLADVPAALAEIRRTVAPGGALVAEYASKRHLKSIARYALRRQQWSPFDRAPYEFVPLNFDFHPAWMTAQFEATGLVVEQELAVSHFRIAPLKRLVPAGTLAAADGAIQGVGARWKLTPSVFVRCRVPGMSPGTLPASLFRCPECQGSLIESAESMDCSECGRRWPMSAGIFDFKEPLDD
ncbi:MAG: class I SAM-dependent methyltransferase [Anaerolineae bacterium]|nr:class I SAM-dependent methyltransferase [Anaerolineae bacterium]